jgi:hypothetical protein
MHTSKPSGARRVWGIWGTETRAELAGRVAKPDDCQMSGGAGNEIGVAGWWVGLKKIKARR